MINKSSCFLENTAGGHRPAAASTSHLYFNCTVIFKLAMQCFNSGQAQETLLKCAVFTCAYVERSQHSTIMMGSGRRRRWVRGLQSGLQCSCRVHKADKQPISYMRFSAKTLAVMMCAIRLYIILSTQRIYCKQPQTHTGSFLQVSHCTGS